MRSDMIRNYMNRTVKIFLEHNAKTLVYTAKIHYLDDDSLEFIDKFGNAFKYPNAEITTIELIGVDG